MTILEQALRLAQAGLSVIPIRADGSKAAAVPWKPFRGSIADPPLTIQRWFGNGSPRGLAVVAGHVSGDLESLDFDHEEIIKPWAELVKLQGAEELLGALVLVKTPRGWHEYYRCTEGVEGNQKLAMRLGSDGKEKVLIETRGEGGYSLLPGCPPECHPLGKTYELVQGDLRAIPVITGEQRLLLLNAARALNEVVSPSAQFWGHPVRPGTAPVTNSMRGRDGRRSWSPPAGRECTSGTGSPFGSAPERPWAYRRP